MRVCSWCRRCGMEFLFRENDTTAATPRHRRRRAASELRQHLEIHCSIRRDGSRPVKAPIVGTVRSRASAVTPSGATRSLAASVSIRVSLVLGRPANDARAPSLPVRSKPASVAFEMPKRARDHEVIEADRRWPDRCPSFLERAPRRTAASRRQRATRFECGDRHLLTNQPHPQHRRLAARIVVTGQPRRRRAHVHVTLRQRAARVASSSCSWNRNPRLREHPRARRQEVAERASRSLSPSSS